MVQAAAQNHTTSKQCPRALAICKGALRALYEDDTNVCFYLRYGLHSGYDSAVGRRRSSNPSFIALNVKVDRLRLITTNMFVASNGMLVN